MTEKRTEVRTMNKARRLLGTIFVSALLILIGIAASPDECFAAEDDIASGTYDDVPWAITSDYTLQIGDGGEYTFTNNLSRNSESYPWHENIYNIKSVEVLGTVHGYGSFSGMFYSFQGCSNMDLSGLDTSNVTDMSGMFRFCESVRELDLSSFDTTDVENMSEMFRACNCLKSLKLSGEFDTTNVKDMSIMFDNCMALESLDLSGFNTSSAENMNSMFSGCTGLITLTTPDWSNPTATLPTFPVKMYNKTTGEEYEAGDTFPQVASTTYKASPIIIDGSTETTVPKDAFEEIAGKDKDLVIQGDDIQWTFHGQDVTPGSGKDIDVTTRIHKENGEKMGFADDSQVLVIDFADNGQLPGKAEIQVINDYISSQKTSGINQLKLSYVSGSQVTLENNGVKIEGDDTAVFSIDHNSRFILSAHKAVKSIRSAKVIVSNCIYNGKVQKPTVTVKLKGKKLDRKYYKTPQFSANKAVGTATVQVTGNPDFGYKGTAKGTFYINPKKAAISSLKVGKKRITVKMKTKPSALGAAKYKIEYRIAGKGKWKSVSATGKSKVIKKLKKGKKYQVRVTAIKDARKGAVSATKKSKKVK